jgi:Domain of unknown function (DUF6285)
MQDRPDFAELLDAVRQFLEDEVAPNQVDRRARFRTLVAINAVTILERELREEPEIVRDEAERLVRLLGRDIALPEQPAELAAVVLALNRELAARIRRGEDTDGVLEHLRHVGAAKLRVASPRYLARY